MIDLFAVPYFAMPKSSPCNPLPPSLVIYIYLYTPQIDQVCTQYEQITITGRIPDITEPTTSSILRPPKRRRLFELLQNI